LHTEEVELELNPVDQSITIMTDSSTSNIRCAPPDEFPDIPKVTQPNFTLPVTQFKEMIQRVAFCASQNTDSNLGAVQLSILDDQLVMFAVDGFHFSFEKGSLTELYNTENIPFLVKGVTLEAISKILPDEGELQVQAESNKAMFHCGDVDIITQLMSGEFPAHDKLQAAIPEPSTTLTISTMELLRAARQLRIFASETGASQLSVQGMLVRYSAIARDKGDSDITFMGIKNGDDVAVGINVHLLYEFLEVCKTDNVIIELKGSKSPIVFRMKDFDEFYHVIMPIGL
jgi:DNA polymerase III sliding clamp (beta) subunit (PCNA family)